MPDPPHRSMSDIARHDAPQPADVRHWGNFRSTGSGSGHCPEHAQLKLSESWVYINHITNWKTAPGRFARYASCYEGRETRDMSCQGGLIDAVSREASMKSHAVRVLTTTACLVFAAPMPLALAADPPTPARPAPAPARPAPAPAARSAPPPAAARPAPAPAARTTTPAARPAAQPTQPRQVDPAAAARAQQAEINRRRDADGAALRARQAEINRQNDARAATVRAQQAAINKKRDADADARAIAARGGKPAEKPRQIISKDSALGQAGTAAQGAGTAAKVFDGSR